MAFSDLAERAGIPEPTVRRRVKHLLGTSQLRLRCEIAQSMSGTPVTAVYWGSVPAPSPATAGQALAALPQVRLCCSLTGARNLLVMGWLPTLGEIPVLKARLTERVPDLVIEDRAVCLRTIKQLGRILDGEGRSVRHTPLSGEVFDA